MTLYFIGEFEGGGEYLGDPGRAHRESKLKKIWVGDRHPAPSELEMVVYTY